VQDKVVDKIEEVVREDIWIAIKDFLEIGWTFGKGETQINLTIGLLILIVLSFFFASFILKWVRKLYTRKMDETDKQKFVSVFKFIKYITYIIVVFATMSFAGVNITPFLAASAALFIGLGLALQ
jgi:small-conductance mechanosensitive channel